MSAQEITIHEVQGDRVKVVLRFLAERVRETGEAVKRRIDMRNREFLALDMRRADMLRIWLATPWQIIVESLPSRQRQFPI